MVRPIDRVWCTSRHLSRTLRATQGIEMARSRLAVMPYAAGLAAVLAFSACTGADPGPPSETSAVSTGATATGTSATATSATANPSTAIDPVLAKIPAAARLETQAGAEAFVAYYFAQLEEGSKTGDPEPLRGLASDDCMTCRAFESSLAALKAAGRHHDGTTVNVPSVDSLQFTDGERTVLVRLTLNSVPIVDSNGQKQGQTEADEGAFVATLDFDDHWLISRLQVAK